MTSRLRTRRLKRPLTMRSRKNALANILSLLNNKMIKRTICQYTNLILEINLHSPNNQVHKKVRLKTAVHVRCSELTKTVEAEPLSNRPPATVAPHRISAKRSLCSKIEEIRKERPRPNHRAKLQVDGLKKSTKDSKKVSLK